MSVYAAKALTRMRERPEVLDYCARNIHRTRTNAGTAAWDELAETERAWWRRVALNVQLRRVRTIRPSEP